MLQIRGSETTLSVTIDGQQLNGSFAKVESWKVTPRTDLIESDFIGEPLTDLDIQHHGYDISFTIRESTRDVIDTLLRIVSLASPTLPGTGNSPAITLTFVRRFRDVGQVALTTICSGVLLKVDDEDASGRKDFVKCSFSGKCKMVTTA